jgi:hypothetical protein
MGRKKGGYLYYFSQAGKSKIVLASGFGKGAGHPKMGKKKRKRKGRLRRPDGASMGRLSQKGKKRKKGKKGACGARRLRTGSLSHFGKRKKEKGGVGACGAREGRTGGMC